jgi:hypothetical protein
VKQWFRAEGWDWVGRVEMNGWSAEDIAQFLIFLPFERRTWEFAASEGAAVAERYWSCAMPLLFTWGEDASEASYAVAMLLKHKQATKAFRVLQLALHHYAELEPNLLMNALQTWLEIEVSPWTAGGRAQGTKYHCSDRGRTFQAAGMAKLSMSERCWNG